MENHALDIIDMLYTMIAEAWGVPLSNDKCMVERDKALNLLDDLKAILPSDLGEARRLLIAREDFISGARREAAEIKAAAEEEARQLVDRQNVYQAACQKAEDTLRDSEQKSAEVRRAAGEYLDDALRKTEEAVAQALESVRSVRGQIRTVVPPVQDGKADVSIEDVEEMEL